MYLQSFKNDEAVANDQLINAHLQQPHNIIFCFFLAVLSGAPTGVYLI